MSIGDTVWERNDGYDTMATRTYLAAVSGFTVYGLIVTSIVAYYCLSWKPESIWPVLGIGLAIPIVGIFIALKSDHWPISLAGYSLVVVGLGVITGPTVAMYSTAVVMKAFLATTGVTVVMSMIGIIYPKSLEHWGGWLFAALLSLLFVRIAQTVMMSLGVSEKIWYMPWVDYIAVLIFCGYIIYDWNRALRLPKTMDNAVDCALAIYLDIINLFIHLLKIMGRNSSSDD